MPITWGWNVTRSRVNEGLKREKGVINRGATVPRQRGYRQLVARQSRPRPENGWRFHVDFAYVGESAL